MNKILTFAALLFVATVSISAALQTNGIAGYAGSPGENNCTNCHTGAAANSGAGSIAITHNIPATGYVTGTVYTINVTVAQAGRSLFGFGFEALTEATNANAGTLTITNTTTTRKANASNGRANIMQKTNGGAAADTKTFTFNWTAPATNVGNVKFWTSGMASNADGDNSGDLIYTTTATVPINTVGISELSDKIALKIYPNPSTETVQITTNIVGAHRITITDISGKMIENKNTTDAINTISIQKMAKGTYFATIYNDKNMAIGTRKFIKN